MKKLIALVLCLIIACTAFACLVSAEEEPQPSYTGEFASGVDEIATNVLGPYSADHKQELRDGFKFFRILTENMTKFAQDVARAFDQMIERLKAFNVDNLFSNIIGVFKN